MQRLDRGDDELNAGFVFEAFEHLLESLRVPDLMTPAWSTMRPVSAGKSNAKADERQAENERAAAKHAAIAGREPSETPGTPAGSIGPPSA